MEKKKPFKRKRKGAVVAGIMSGLADYFGWDVNLLRVVVIALSVWIDPFMSAFAYLLIWAFVPIDQPLNRQQTMFKRRPGDRPEQERRDVTPKEEQEKE